MRFILFNAAVIAALVTIYSAERDTPMPAMERFESAFAAEAPVTIEPVEPAAPAPIAEPAEELLPEPLEEEIVAEASEPVAPRALPPVSDPAVAKRRREILEGLEEVPTAAPGVLAETQAPLVLAEGESLMSNRERITELHRLAEEMELLFVESLAK